MEAVNLRHVDKAYTTYSTEVVLTGQTRESRTRQVLKDLTVTFPAGQLTVIVGRSGCGKSTLLKLLAGQEKPDAGEIEIPEGWHSAMLRPDPYVITWTNVQRNVAMACGVGKTPEERYEKATEYVRLVGLEDYADLTPVELSTASSDGRAVCLAGFSDAGRVTDAAAADTGTAAPHHHSGNTPAGGGACAGTEDRRDASGQLHPGIRPFAGVLSTGYGQPGNAAAEKGDHGGMQKALRPVSA